MKSKSYNNRCLQKITICFLFFYNLSFSRDGGSFLFRQKYDKLYLLDKQGDIYDMQHCIKWNYSLLGRGVFLLNYERIFDPKLSIEVGFGLTRRDMLYEISKGRSFVENRDLIPDFGFAFEGGIRFYPSDFDDFEGIYLSPMLSYRTYSFSVEKTSSSYTYPVLPSSFNPGYNFFDLQLKFGYQSSDIWDWDVLSDLYIGFGFRSATAQYYQLDNSGTTTVLSPVTKKSQYPQALLGCKIAVPF